MALLPELHLRPRIRTLASKTCSTDQCSFVSCTMRMNDVCYAVQLRRTPLQSVTMAFLWPASVSQVAAAGVGAAGAWSVLVGSNCELPHIATRLALSEVVNTSFCIVQELVQRCWCRSRVESGRILKLLKGCELISSRTATQRFPFRCR